MPNFPKFHLHYPLVLTIVALLLGGCGEPEKADDEFRLAGQIEGLQGKTIQLERLEGISAVPVTEVETDDNGNFTVNAKGKKDAIFQLRIKNGGRILVMPEFDALKITANANEMEAFQVEGNAKTKLLRDFNLNQYRLYLAFAGSEAELDAIDRKVDSTQWHEVEVVTDKAMVEYRNYLRTFCDTVSIPVLRAHAALSLTVNGNYHYLEKMTARIQSELPGSPAAGALNNALTQEANRRIGEIAANITSTDVNGKPFDLSKLRGKPVLLYFWASYCEFSRVENAKMDSLEKLFADNNIALVCVSLDDNDTKWRAGLQAAGLKWATHIRLLNGAQSTEISQYLVKAIPANYLIDGAGMIRDLDIRSDEMLRDLPALVKAFERIPVTPL
jgi:thiol-disulfide isomerase/thioredoxin